MPVFNNPLAGAAGSGGAAGYKIERSLRFDSGSSSYLSRTPSSAGNRNTWTWSGWVKRTTMGADKFIFAAGGDPANFHYLRFKSNDTLEATEKISDSVQASLVTDVVYRDPSAWYHIVYVYDSTQSTAANRMSLYVNGAKVTVLGTSTYPSQNHNTYINNNIAHYINSWSVANGHADAYLAELHFIDGQALAASDFGEYDDNGVWQPKEYSGTYGTNGYYLNFSDNSSNAALGFDSNVSGTRYSAYVTGFGSPGPANMFDGDATTSYAVSTTGGRMTFTPPTAIPYTDASGGVEVKFMASSSGQLDRVRINGGSWVTQPSGGGWHKVSTGDGSITSMDFEDEGTQEAVVHAIRVNGTVLTDPSGANDWTVNNVTASVPTYTATAASGALGSSIFDGSNTKTYWQTSITITGITVASGASFGYRGVVESGNSAPSHTITKNGTEIGSFTGTVGNNNWVASTNYTVNQGTISEAIGPSDTIVITTDVQAWHGTDQITINGSPIVQPSQGGIDSLFDSPTNYDDGTNIGGNHCTLNPLTTTGGNSGTSNGTLSEGNLKLTNTASNTWCVETGTIGVSSGKWYYEYVCSGTITNFLGGWADPQEINYNDAVGNTGRSYGYYSTGNVRNSNNNTGFGSSYTAGDVIGCAIDIDNRKIYWSKNGSWQNSANLVAGTGSVYTIQDPVANGFVYTPAVSTYDANSSVDVNFGQRSFKYPPGGTGGPPSGYKSLCTQNFDDPLIEDPSKSFNIELWTGNNTTGRVIPTNFSADLIWIKYRNTTEDHVLIDTIRGANNFLIPNSTAIQNTSGGPVTAISDSGFTIDNNGYVNASNGSYVGWTWDAGSSTTTVSAGGLNSSAYDQSQTWSDSLSASFRSSEPATNAFDGDTSTIAGSAGTITYTSPVAVASNSTIRVFLHGGDHDVSVNGGADQTVAAGSFQTLNFTNPTNSTFTITFDRVGSADTGVRAIEIGGKLLVDYGVSVTNVPKVASDVRANPTAGFSIVKASVAASLTGGPTLAHGLNKKPEFIIGKNLDSTIYWYAYHKDLSENHYLIPHLTNAEQNSGAVWGSHSSLDSNVFQIGAGTPASMWIPSGTDDCIFYVWTSVKDYSAFGKYTGNGSSNGVFVALPFRPKWLLVKSISATGGWRTYDSARKTYNVIDNSLHLNTNEDETAYSNDEIDFLSNGFKARSTGSFLNGNGTNYIYAAFAENPFKYARAR